MKKAHALNPRQYANFKQLERGGKIIERPQVGVDDADRVTLSNVLLMTVGDNFPVYDSITPRKAALFQLSRTTLQATVKFYGENLWGRVALTIGEIAISIDCRATTDELRASLNGLRDCRITAFPGLWEFAFAANVSSIPMITCEPALTSSSQRFLGGCVVNRDRQGWRSTTADGDQPSLVEVIDSIPYLEGEVKRGAMAIGARYGAALYVAGQWSCPRFTFRTL